MKVLGISCGHDANVCVVDEQGILIHLEKERFTRKRHDAGKVDKLINIALENLRLTIDDIDLVASSLPVWPEYGRSGEIVTGDLYRSIFEYSEHAFQLFGKRFPSVFVPHHLGHMAYAYYLSGFNDADLIAVDGYGNFTATAVGVGEGRQLMALRDLAPSNIGALWAMVTRHIFGNMLDAGKTMGLAPYGEPRFLTALQERYLTFENGFPILRNPWVDSDDIPFLGGLSNTCDPLSDVCRDMASSVQQLTSELMIEYVKATKRLSGKTSLCISGGVALNGIANDLIVRSGLYENVFIGPATNDAGLSIGFALYALHHVRGESLRRYAEHIYLSSSYDDQDCVDAFAPYMNQLIVEQIPADSLAKTVADILIDGAIVGWFQGRAESGPRALGHRSILCNPRVSDMKDQLNNHIKHREGFRPFGPSVLEESKSEYFHLNNPSPYMLRVVDVVDHHKGDISAVVHVDGTSRPQTVGQNSDIRLFRDLISAFRRRSGVPMLLNTSFNICGEPIVESPKDAIRSLMASSLDYLVLTNYLIRKRS
jgi:carbamoyltransferase